MPMFLAPLVVSAAYAIGWTTITAAAAALITHGLILGSTLVFGAVQAKRIKEKQRAAAVGALQDRTATVNSSDAPWRVIYGEAVVGAIAVPAMLTSGSRDEYKHLPLVWAAHECQAVDDILIKGSSIGTLDGSGNVTGGRWFKGSTQSRSQSVTFNGSGSATLSHAPVTVQAVTIPQYWTDPNFGTVSMVDTAQDISGLVVAGSTITKAALAGLTATVSYTYVASGTPMLRAQHHTGSPAQSANAALIAECPADWSSSDRLRGLCYSVLRLCLDEAEFQGGPPQATARVRGRKVYDPRKDSTNGGSGAHRLYNYATYEYSNNVALCVADFLMAEWGKRALAAQIHWPSVIAAANACDEVLPNGQRRYTCNGAFTTDQDTDTTLNQLCQAMAGFAVFNGTWTLQAGVYTAPVMALTDADNAGSVEVLAGPSGQEVFNGLRGRFYDPARFDQATDYTPYANAAFVTADGGALWGDLPLPFTNADWRCANLARIQVERSRGMQLVYPAKNRARALQAGQRLTLSNAFLGLSADVFRVVKKEQQIGLPVKLTLVQDDSSMYDEADAPAPLGSPSSLGTDPFVVGAVANLAALSDITVAQWNADGTVLGNTFASWDASTDALVVERGALQLEYRHAEATAWTRLPEQPGSSTGVLMPLLAERQLFILRARWRNGLGATGDWAYTYVLTQRLPAPRATASLIDATWWRPGATWEWPQVTGANASNDIAWAIGPKDLQQAVWRATAVAAGGTNGGFEAGSASYPKNLFEVDVRSTYRFALPVFLTSGHSGSWSWGPSAGGVVCALNGTTPQSDPRFYTGTVSAGWKGKWCLLAGYVFPAGSTGLTNAGAGVYDMNTGALLAAGTNFCWAAAATECSMRAFFTGAGAAGHINLWAQPSVEVFNAGDIGRITWIGTSQVATLNVASYAITNGAVVDSSTVTGSSGSPGASTRVATLWGPTLTTAAGDELDIVVSGVLEDTFWSQAAVASVELWLTHAPTFGGTQTEFGTRKKFFSPVDVYTNPTRFSLDMTGQLVPGAVTQDYVLRVSIAYKDAAGAAKQCGKNFTADAQWRVVKRKR